MYSNAVIMNEKQGLPVMLVASPQEWEDWLHEHHASSSGLWLRIAKRESGAVSVSYAAALDIALCYGWIDGQKASLDAQFWLQKFSPRRPKSVWSKLNRDKVERLIQEQRMQPAGLAAVEQAKRDGRWQRAYPPQSAATVPDDLQRALDKVRAAAAFFATLTGANRYAVLYRIQDAKRPETRERRIAQFVEKLSRGETLYP